MPETPSGKGGWNCTCPIVLTASSGDRSHNYRHRYNCPVLLLTPLSPTGSCFMGVGNGPKVMDQESRVGGYVSGFMYQEYGSGVRVQTMFCDIVLRTWCWSARHTKTMPLRLGNARCCVCRLQDRVQENGYLLSFSYMNYEINLLMQHMQTWSMVLLSNIWRNK